MALLRIIGKHRMRSTPSSQYAGTVCASLAAPATLLARGVRLAYSAQTPAGTAAPRSAKHVDRIRYRSRNVIERGIGWLKECLSVATRYAKLAQHYLGLVKRAIIEHDLQRLSTAEYGAERRCSLKSNSCTEPSVALVIWFCQSDRIVS
jgi:transposase